MRGIFGMLLSVFLGFSALSAAAQTSNGPCPAPGTQIRWSDGADVEAVSDAGAGMCRFKDRRNGKIFEKMIGAILPATPLVQPHMDELRMLVPLEVGKSVSFQHAGADDKGNNST